MRRIGVAYLMTIEARIDPPVLSAPSTSITNDAGVLISTNVNLHRWLN